MIEYQVTAYLLLVSSTLTLASEGFWGLPSAVPRQRRQPQAQVDFTNSRNILLRLKPHIKTLQQNIESMNE